MLLSNQLHSYCFPLAFLSVTNTEILNCCRSVTGKFLACIKIANTQLYTRHNPWFHVVFKFASQNYKQAQGTLTLAGGSCLDMKQLLLANFEDIIACFYKIDTWLLRIHTIITYG